MNGSLIILKTEISPATGKPVSRLCLNTGAELVNLFKAVADIQHLTPEQCFEQAVRPYVLALAERQDSDIEALETIEHAVNGMFMGGRRK